MIGKNPEYDAVLPYAGKETIQRILEISKNQTDDTLFASVHTPGSYFTYLFTAEQSKVQMYVVRSRSWYGFMVADGPWEVQKRPIRLLWVFSSARKIFKMSFNNRF